MIHAIQHVPTFVDGCKPLEAKVGTVAALLEVPWIKAWRESTGFDRFSRSDGNRLLMVERNGGRWWWVVASVQGDISELPEWEPTQRE